MLTETGGEQEKGHVWMSTLDIYGQRKDKRGNFSRMSVGFDELMAKLT